MPKDSVLNFTKFGDVMIQKVLKRYKNIEMICGAEITNYNIDEITKKVTNIQLQNGTNFPVDAVVLCTGPQSPRHVYEHFGCVLPSISAQGYAFDFAIDPAVHQGVNLLLLSSPYSMSQYTPGQQRMSAFVDWGTFDKPFID